MAVTRWLFRGFAKFKKFRKNPKNWIELNPSPYPIFLETHHWHGQNTQIIMTSIWDDFPIIIFFPKWDHFHSYLVLWIFILTTNLAAVVCVCVCVSVCVQKFDQFLPSRSHFNSKRPNIFVRIATFPSATFGPLFSFHCPLFVTEKNNLEWKSSRFAAVDRRSVADKQLHLNGVIHSAGVTQCQELSPKT